MPNLTDVLVNDIFNHSYCFFIPAYQRGYRWTKNEIRKLLDDLYEFNDLKSKKSTVIGEYYCLQPITYKLKKKDEDKTTIEIVDGQQRLTTIYLILKLFPNLSDNLCCFEYERDSHSLFSRKQFLQKLSPGNIPEPKTVDEYFFRDAFNEIEKWFREKKQSLGNLISSSMELMLLGNTKLILYELGPNEDCYTVFKNLNKCKIPLTDAELVKAMLLNRRNFYANSNETIIKQKQDYYARFWDEMQKSFNDNSLWSFITAGTDVDIPNHIDLLFLLDARKKGAVLADNESQDYKLFNIYEEGLHSSDDKEKYVSCIFEDIRKLFRTIQSWNSDSALYNFIGYRLTYEGTSEDKIISTLSSLIGEYENVNHDVFLNNHLLENIVKPFMEKGGIEALNYNEDGKKVEKALMLFNIFELNEIKRKFNFGRYKDHWTIEHINAQKSTVAEGKAEIWTEYLANEKRKIELIETNTNVSYKSLRDEIDSFLFRVNKMKKNDQMGMKNEFVRLANKISCEIDGFSDEDEQSLGNLALLLNHDNIELSNLPFYEKRNLVFSWLEEFDKNIPYSTAKAFQKMYSPQNYNTNYIQWKKTDCEAMFKRQKELFEKNYNKTKGGKE